VQQVLDPLARRHLTWLYNALIEPLVDVRAEHHKLIIIPHDVLHNIPFAALHDGNNYLIERFAVQYAPSSGVLAHCYRAQEVTGTHGEDPSALVMGYSDGGRLQHVLEEVQSVAAVLPSSTLFQEETATLSRFYQHAVDCRLIHLATHAFFRSDNSLFSSIKLADGPLNVIDIYSLRLKASLITLSGCETGKGELKGGDLFGLVRGCLYAGVSALLVSLWQVDDASTTMLMKAFYRQLDTGQSIASALRTAQRTMLETQYRHPHYWAPFFLVGADGYV
jgi:CHAT domain-containing protein